MINKSKLALAAVVGVLSIASPALAQSYNPGDGTANALSFSYGPGGAKQRWTVVAPVNQQVAAVRRNGLGAYAMMPRTPGAALQAACSPG